MAESNSVFISYRRSVSSYIARAIFQDLRANGFDVFMDIESIDQGDFDTIILNQIAARPYFLIILTPSTLDRCKESGDWLMKEIEHAFKLERKIVPLITPEFKFEDAKKFLVEPYATDLPRKNALEIPHNYFEAAMNRLRARFLKPIELNLTPPPLNEEIEVKHRIEDAAAIPKVTIEQLNAEGYLRRGFPHIKNAPDIAISNFNEALILNPNFEQAYHAKVIVYLLKRDADNAINTLSEAIQIDPENIFYYHMRASMYSIKFDFDRVIEDCISIINRNSDYPDAYFLRGSAYFSKDELNNAIEDFNKALQLRPDDASIYYIRGSAFKHKGNLDNAIEDFNKALQLRPDHAETYCMRGVTYSDKGNLDNAIEDFNKALQLRPDHAETYMHRGFAYITKGDPDSAVLDFEVFLRYPSLVNHQTKETVRDYIAKHKK